MSLSRRLCIKESLVPTRCDQSARGSVFGNGTATMIRMAHVHHPPPGGELRWRVQLDGARPPGARTWTPPRGRTDPPTPRGCKARSSWVAPGRVSRSSRCMLDQNDSAIFEWIEAWYNPQRRHTSLGMLAPHELETLHTAADTAAASPHHPCPEIRVRLQRHAIIAAGEHRRSLAHHLPVARTLVPRKCRRHQGVRGRGPPAARCRHRESGVSPWCVPPARRPGCCRFWPACGSRGAHRRRRPATLLATRSR